jgi:precorrin-6Y C5,15-methyltransferase (decarboxylating)
MTVEAIGERLVKHEAVNPGKIHVVGIPPGRVTPQEEPLRRLLSMADLLVGREEYLAPWPGLPSLKLGSNWEEVVELAERKRAEGKLVVFLASGDPLFFGIGSTLVRRLGAEKVVVHPAVSSMQVAFARIGESWEDATFLSAHSGSLIEVAKKLASSGKACVLTSGSQQPSRLAEALLRMGCHDLVAFLCENLGFEDERITKMSLEELSRARCSPLNLILFRRQAEGENRLREGGCLLGLPDEELSRPPGKEGMITKRELRAIVLSHLQLRQGDVLWDVGSGSGAVSVEASRMMGTGRVYAVERDPRSVEALRRNIHRYSAAPVEVVAGEAPEALEPLPPPDAVFLGGSGGRLGEILDLCCRRLKSGGRLVANFASPERALEAKKYLERNGMLPELFLFQGARLFGTRGGELLSALNPVFVVSTTKG